MKPDEAAFEAFVATWLVDHGGYDDLKGPGQARPPTFDPVPGLDTAELFQFIGATQADAWERLKQRLGGVPGRAGQVRRPAGVGDRQAGHGRRAAPRRGRSRRHDPPRLLPAGPRPHPGAGRRYEANRLTVTRQLPYEAGSTKTLDLALFVNGIPVATAELKNHADRPDASSTRSTQYRTDRDPANRDARRAGGRALRRRPRAGGDDHPARGQVDAVPAVQPGPRPAGRATRRTRDGHRTAYLWEQVWAAGRLAGPARPVRPRREAGEGLRRRRGSGDLPALPPVGRRAARWRRRPAAEGAGPEVPGPALGRVGEVEHDRLAGAPAVEPARRRRTRRCSTRSIVITDRVVLDRQLQDTIYQFEHAHGVVVKIDAELRAARRRARRASRRGSSSPRCRSSRSCSTRSRELPDRAVRGDRRRGPLLADRRGGQGAAGWSLGATDETELTVAEAEDAGLIAEPVDPVEEALAKAVGGAGPAAEPVVLRVHRDAEGARPWSCSARCDPADEAVRAVPPVLDAPGDRGGLHPRRAGQLRHLRDVLAASRRPIADDPEYDTAQGRGGDRPVRVAAPTQPGPEGRDHRRALPRSTPPRKIGGRAKAMVVTSSRLHAVRYKQAIDALHRRARLRRRRRARRVLRHGRSTTASTFTEAGHERLPRDRRPPRSSTPTSTRCWSWPRSSRPGSTSRCCTRCTSTRSSPGSTRCRPCRG